MDKSLVEKLPIFIAAASTALYVLGFIVVTSYLASKGIYDQSLLSTKYILAGALVSIVALTYYFFVWRKVAHRIRNGVEWPNKIGGTFRAFLDTYYVIEYVFGCCFTAILLLVLMGHTEYIGIQVLVSIVFIIDFALVHFHVYVKHPKFCFIATFILNQLAIYVCILHGLLNQPLFSLIFIFISITLVGSVVLTSEGWKSGVDRSYGTFYFALYTLIGVVGFGATVYEFISPKFGGAAPALVSVHLSSKADESIKQIFKENAGSVYLVIGTDTSSTFRLGKVPNKVSFFQIDRALIDGMMFDQPIQTIQDFKNSMFPVDGWVDYAKGLLSVAPK